MTPGADLRAADVHDSGLHAADVRDSVVQPTVDSQGSLLLRAGDAQASLLPALGGAVAAFAWRGIPVLRPTPADAIADGIAAGDVRRTAAYPLLPYSNRIADARLAAGDRVFTLARNFGDHPHAIHGVGWQRAWTVARADAASALLTLAHDPSGSGNEGEGDDTSWPWPFVATQAFALNDRGNRAQLAVTMTLRNTGQFAFPFGLGWHPFFPVMLSTTLEFGAAAVWRNDVTQLPVARTDIPPEWDFSAARSLIAAARGAPLDNVFVQWSGSATLATPESGLATTIEADRACAFLVVYAPDGAPFVAVEPVTHQTDAFNRAARGARDTGTRVLPPGAGFSCTMRVTAARNPAGFP